MSFNNKVLKRGDSGSSVKELQNLLNQNGAKLDVDGVFGPNTQSALVNYQRKNGLTVDGTIYYSPFFRFCQGQSTHLFAFSGKGG